MSPRLASNTSRGDGLHLEQLVGAHKTSDGGERTKPCHDLVWDEPEKAKGQRTAGQGDLQLLLHTLTTMAPATPRHLALMLSPATHRPHLTPPTSTPPWLPALTQLTVLGQSFVRGSPMLQEQIPKEPHSDHPTAP